ncbi:GntR family transcriptional regulator [Nitratireductor sp. GISD-1A_MAKvit]|uniref:GntR family transcriptional regulator n=1 Tax=Nitratireductor sp. GISD-1A_MAKvit TaxID=3234198 RepID=UPI00346780A2
MSKREIKSGLAERLRADIAAGFYRPGEWLRLVDLEERYGVGRFDVRQALAQLATGHMVSHVPNRGYRVAQTDRNQRDELTNTRLLLEVPAAELVLEQATAEDVERIEGAARAFDEALGTVSYPEAQKLNHAFHHAFYACCGNRTLIDLIHELRERNLPGEWNLWAMPAKARSSSLDHLEMVEALKTRDRERMAAVVSRHLTRWREETPGKG